MAVRVFDGAGHEWTARVSRADRRAVVVDLLEPVTPQEEWDVRVVLAQAVLKGEGMDDVVRDATMIGVAGVQPLASAHGAVGARAADPRLRERWQRVAVASAKQCGRAVVPSVAALLSFEAAIGERGDRLGLLLVEPSAVAALPQGEGCAVPLAALHTPARGAGVHLLVGPEGGWAPTEVAGAVAAGYRAWTLGALTLRAEAAALCALSILRYVWAR
jgi:16S rRNA (uracil1498-N3)-methyltransferase